MGDELGGDGPDDSDDDNDVLVDNDSGGSGSGGGGEFSPTSESNSAEICRGSASLEAGQTTTMSRREQRRSIHTHTSPPLDVRFVESKISLLKWCHWQYPGGEDSNEREEDVGGWKGMSIEGWTENAILQETYNMIAKNVHKIRKCTTCSTARRFDTMPRSKWKTQDARQAFEVPLARNYF